MTNIKIIEKFDYWKSQLRDMGRRNNLLFFRDTKGSTILIKEPDIDDIFERVISEGKPIYSPLSPDDRKHKDQKNLFEYSESENDEDDEDDYEIQNDEFISNKNLQQQNQVLQNLRYRSRTIQEEQGFNALYLTFGMLKWREVQNSEFIESPIILVPIQIVREELGTRFQIAMDEEEIVVNPTLQAKLSNEFQIILEELPSVLDEDEIEDYFKRLEDIIGKHPHWKVQKKVAIGIFNFQTLMIIKDLEKNEGIYTNHPIIKMLSGINSSILDEQGNIPTAEELDDKVPPEEVFQILDADSSQQEAIEAAKRGVSFVLQGPPGTGKSQTIANIIAESLATGKKVLFVSQKSVALDVVYKRLEQKGLGRFCLEVHNYKKNKIDVIADLGKSLSGNGDAPAPNTSIQRQEIRETRSQLNSFVRELHEPRFTIQLSLYRVQGEWAKLLDEPALRFSLENLREFSQEDFQSHILKIRELTSSPHLIETFLNHPWKGFKQETISVQEREQLTEDLEALSSLLKTLKNEFTKIGDSYGLRDPKTTQDLYSFIAAFSNFQFDILTEENKNLARRILNEYESFARFVQPSYWKDISNLSKLLWKEEKLKLPDLQNKLRTILDLLNPEKEPSNDKAEQPNIPYKLILAWQATGKQIENLYASLRAQFHEDEAPEEFSDNSKIDLSNSIPYFKQLAGQVYQLPEWLSFVSIVQEAQNIGLANFLEHILSAEIAPENWENAYKRRFFLLLSDEITQANSVLRNFNSTTHTSLTERFRELDKEIIDLSTKEIQAKLESVRPDATWVQADSAEVVILKKELHKKRRIKPLRILFAEIPNLLLTLRPCLMMSPLTVSQLLDPDIYKFDIAIFDEASQIPPEYAVGTIVRAKQVIIAGDRHQLPPTNFFKAIESDDDEENYEKEEYESILDACDAISMPNKMLSWHYRSEDESLIAFSNYNFYDNKLYTFPTASNNNQLTGLEFIYVPEGIYRRGKGGRNNVIEARKIAEYIRTHLEKNPELSLGVVTFSQSQRQIIEQELELLKKQHPELYGLFDYNKDEEIFVKNLETVQGDERDVIIFSVGYGRDETGNFTMNFGPLNRQGGERRLNVAVTRARKAVKLFTSIEPEDIDLSRTNSKGAKLLKMYMRVARDGTKALFDEAEYHDTAEFGSPFEEAVFDALRKEGLELHKQVGVSRYRIDFGVVDSEKQGRYILGIECDGAMYHSAPTARDRDRLRQELLEKRFGWRIHRIWSRDWLNDPRREIDKILAAVDKYKDLADIQPIKKK